MNKIFQVPYIIANESSSVSQFFLDYVNNALGYSEIHQSVFLRIEDGKGFSKEKPMGRIFLLTVK